jgi:hypothetical protein
VTAGAAGHDKDGAGAHTEYPRITLALCAR